MSKFQYKTVAVGGTFDRLHRGHEALLTTAFTISDEVFIGVTSDAMVKEKAFASIILPYEVRVTELTKFLKKRGWLPRSHITQLSDPYGPLNNSSHAIEAVVVGPKTTAGVVDKLKKRLKVVYCPFIKSNDQEYLSSTRIRRGEVNRQGVVYQLPKTALSLPELLRASLREPLGEVKEKFDLFKPIRSVMTITVGDECTRALHNVGVYVDLAVVDFHVQRKEKYHSYNDLGFSMDELSCIHIDKVSSPAGTITGALHITINQGIKRFLAANQRSIIRIIGEDDLATLPAVLHAPLSTVIFYGQPRYQTVPGKPNEGLVRVVVTEEVKMMVQNLLSRFQQQPVL